MCICIGLFISRFPYFSFPKLPKSLLKKKKKFYFSSKFRPDSEKKKLETVNPCSYKEMHKVLGNLNSKKPSFSF